eukprot:TRINITY_DN58568_c0_g2_i1.p1 TRINITY_DN58568_c0_g2~~TRINITY_DN58568_c0_g2_i1.p1  ORF type:complete len:430 (-),score=8.30 TRINITY_DN58568_c0_g2_i1:423-1712(-)
MTRYLSSLPNRALPILGGDFNAKVGLQRDPAGEWSTGLSSACGVVSPDQEDSNVSALRRVCEAHNLTVVNTHCNAGATYYGKNLEKPTRIEHVVTRRSAFSSGRCWGCYVLHSHTKYMQNKISWRPWDHLALQCCFDARLAYDGPAKDTVRWDRDALVHACNWDNSKVWEVRNHFNQWWTDNQAEWNENKHKTPSHIYAHTAAGVLHAANATFVLDQSEQRDPIGSELSRCRINIIRDIASIKADARLPAMASKSVFGLPQLGVILHMWRKLARLWATQRRLRVFNRRDRRARRKQIEQQISEAWNRRQLHTAWRLTRSLLPRHGPKARINAYKAMPSRDDWVSFAAKHGTQGGHNADYIDLQHYTDNYHAVHFATVDCNIEERAKQIVRRIIRDVPKQAKRKAVPFHLKFPAKFGRFFYVNFGFVYLR